MNRPITTGHVQLDEPDNDEQDDGPEFPTINPVRFTDPYSGTVATFEVIEDDDPHLIVTHGDANEEVFVRFKLTLDEDTLFQLAEKFIMPLREYRVAEKAHTDRDTKARMEQDAAELATRPFRAASVGIVQGMRDYELRVHLRDCRHAMDATRDRGTRGTTGTLARERCRDDLPLINAANLMDSVRQARAALEACYSPRGVESNARRAERFAEGHQRHTALNYQPVKFCRTCKPLGERTASINAIVRDLANLTELNDSAEQTAATTFEAIEQALWDAEQAHLDTLRGRG